ncbi:hypothetical protein EDB83DRAFT_2518738 [Lactarius deliciosus]|nr:hypothetical protein EDB83DRAFT_2518738 [Lactarius deliciosus]
MEERFMALVVTPLQEFAAICPETTLIDGVDEGPAGIRTAFLAALRAGVLSVKVILAGRPRDCMRGIVEALAPLDVHLRVHRPERRRHRAIPAARTALDRRGRRAVPVGEAGDCPR